MTDQNRGIEDLLDALKEDSTRAPDSIRVNVVARLQTKPDAAYDLLPWLRISLWRPLCTAALPLLLGFGLGYADFAQEVVYDVDDLLLGEERPTGSLSDALGTLELMDE